MEKFLYYNELFLIYKDLLSEKAQDIFNLYYGENMTMQEIADLKNISKARVGIVIKNVERKLDKYESILNISKINNELNKILELNDVELIKKNINNLLKGE